jgi:hypothetical protein
LTGQSAAHMVHVDSLPQEQTVPRLPKRSAIMAAGACEIPVQRSAAQLLETDSEHPGPADAQVMAP